MFASTLTFIGSVTTVVFEGATPVFIDCDRSSWNMDPDLLEGGTTNAGLANYRKVKWIKVITLSSPVDPLLRTSLDAGEAAVIGLAGDLM